MKYYFLVTYLPEIQRDDKKVKLRFADLLAEREYMAPEDWRQVELVLLARDFLLLEKLLAGKDADVEHSLYDKEFWKEQVKAPKEVPEYLEDFLLMTAEERTFGPDQVNQLHQLEDSVVNVEHRHVTSEAATERGGSNFRLCHDSLPFRYYPAGLAASISDPIGF